MNALLARFPQLDLPWVSLVPAPTPVERAPSLGARMWVKRDDLTATPYGGNKVRKLEFLLGEAQARGCRAVLTIGASGSNHVLATAVHAQRLGFAATHAVLFPQPMTPDVERKQAAYRALGVRISHVAVKPFVPFGAIARMIASIAAREGRPYYIAPGGSSPVGALGYVAAALELADQIAAGELPAPATIHVPLGSGGTVAGLLVGIALAGLPSRVVATQVVPRPWVSGASALKLAKATARLLARHGVAVPGLAPLEVVETQLGAGYGVTTAAAEDAKARAAAAGLRLETTYSAKALAALLSAARDEDALFWLTYASADSLQSAE